MTKLQKEKASAILRISQSHGFKNDGGYQEIEKSIKKLPGVLKARINYTTGTIEINYNPGELTLDKIKETLRTLGQDRD
jgi:copper chaperone CopZ